MAKIVLTEEQRMAYEALVTGVRAIVRLDGGDTETLLAWLWASFDGPIGLSPPIYEACVAALQAVQQHEYQDAGSLWEEQLEMRMR